MSIFREDMKKMNLMSTKLGQRAETQSKIRRKQPAEPKVNQEELDEAEG